MIFTLCGSARFESVWHEANKQLGLAGHISFSMMTFPSIEGDKSWYTPEQKWTLDLCHLAKIEESDAVLMLNVNDYLGESSLRELEWARIRNKQVYFLHAFINGNISQWMKEGNGTRLLGNILSAKAIDSIWSME